ncbi:MAG TPA: nitrous oxide reductase family maturation protein NosD [candidate division Zixibacteria bacterium]|nr:nitrous oxide reductase family maturation protein NosD [candidate division Zixibacteria bacterium]
MTGLASARVVTVQPGGEHATVAAGVAAARAHDTVAVKAGVYREHGITIDRPLTLAGGEGAVVDADGAGGIFTVTAPDVEIRNLRLRGVPTSFTAEHAAIQLEGAVRATIENNSIEACFFGIYAANSHTCRLQGNIIRGAQTRLTSSGNGIHLWYCRDITILENTIAGHRDGIYMEFVRAGTVDRNRCEENLRYGLHFMFSDSCQYADNLFRRNGAGVAVMYTSNVLMENNTFEQSWGGASYGVLLKDIRDSRVTGNRFCDNSTGVHMEGSDRVYVAGNLFAGNGWALKLMANCLDNTVSANDFVDNSFAVATNSRQNNSRFEGNYWSGYRGVDLDRDGYGDLPFRPVSLFSLLVESHPPTLVLLRSLLVEVLDLAERAMPTLTPETLVDRRPRMRPNL